MEQKLEQMKSTASEMKATIDSAGLPEKPLPSLAQAADMSAERAKEATDRENKHIPIKATAAVVGKPIAEILKPSVSSDTSGSSPFKFESAKMAPKAGKHRKLLGIKTIHGIKSKPKSRPDG